MVSGLYRRNAFRVVGVATDAGRREVRDRQRRIVTALAAGADVDVDVQHGLDEVRASFERILGDARVRLAEEVLWLWDTTNPACGCPRTLHTDHDNAVRAHAAALETDTVNPDELERLWSDAGRAWSRALGRDDFWDHLRRRIDALDDRQLDEETIATIRDELPLTLVRPLIRIVAAHSDKRWLVPLVRGWPAPAGAVDDLLEQAAEPLYADVRHSLRKATEQQLNDPRAAAATVIAALPVARGLTAFVPPSRHSRTASVRDDLALVLNNCATTHLRLAGPAAGPVARTWLGLARELASDGHSRDLIDQNVAALDEMTAAAQAIRDQVGAGRPDLTWRKVNTRVEPPLTRPNPVRRGPRRVVRAMVALGFCGMVGYAGVLLVDGGNGLSTPTGHTDADSACRKLLDEQGLDRIDLTSRAEPRVYAICVAK
jgi:hypothetical protein